MALLNVAVYEVDPLCISYTQPAITFISNSVTATVQSGTTSTKVLIQQITSYSQSNCPLKWDLVNITDSLITTANALIDGNNVVLSKVTDAMIGFHQITVRVMDSKDNNIKSTYQLSIKVTCNPASTPITFPEPQTISKIAYASKVFTVTIPNPSPQQIYCPLTMTVSVSKDAFSISSAMLVDKILTVTPSSTEGYSVILVTATHSTNQNIKGYYEIQVSVLCTTCVDASANTIFVQSRCEPKFVYLERDDQEPLPKNTLELMIGDSVSYLLPVFIIKSYDTNPEVDVLCAPIDYKMNVLNSSGENMPTQTIATFIKGHNELSIAAVTNDQQGKYSFEFTSSLKNYPEVSQTIKLFDLLIVPQPIVEPNTSQSYDVTEIDNPKSNSTSTGPKPNFKFDWKPPRYELAKIPNAPELGRRVFAHFLIEEITPLGLMTLRMNETVLLHKLEDYKNLTKVDFDVVFVKNSFEEDQKMTFEILEVTPIVIKVNLTFEKPILVSQWRVSDQVVVKLNKDYFLIPQRMSRGNTVVDKNENPYQVVSEQLPKMLSSQAELKMLETIGSTSSNAITVMILIPIFAGIGLKGILSKLWAMLNTIQLIHSLSVIQVSVPSNVITIQKQSQAIINFQPINKDLIYRIVFGKKDENTESLTSARRMLQDEEDISAQNVTDLISLKHIGEISTEKLKNFDLSPSALIKTCLLAGIILAVVILLIALIYFCVKKVIPRCHPKIRQLCLSLKHMLMFNSILRYFMMSFLSISIGSCIQIKLAIDNLEDFQKVESILSLSVLILFVILPICLTRYMIKNMANLNKPYFKQSYGTLYTPCETRKGKLPLIYLVIFCTRRLLFALTIAFLIEYPMLQICLTALISHFVLIWHVMVWPMESKRHNILYLINEYLYMGCCFFTLAFSEYNPDPETRLKCGWIYLLFIALIVIANFVVMIIDMVLGIMDYCHQRKLHQQVEQQKKKKALESALAEMEHPKRSSQRKKIATQQLKVIYELSSSEESDSDSDEESKNQHDLQSSSSEQNISQQSSSQSSCSQQSSNSYQNSRMSHIKLKNTALRLKTQTHIVSSSIDSIGDHSSIQEPSYDKSIDSRFQPSQSSSQLRSIQEQSEFSQSMVQSSSAMSRSINSQSSVQFSSLSSSRTTPSDRSNLHVIEEEKQPEQFDYLKRNNNMFAQQFQNNIVLKDETVEVGLIPCGIQITKQTEVGLVPYGNTNQIEVGLVPYGTKIQTKVILDPYPYKQTKETDSGDVEVFFDELLAYNPKPSPRRQRTQEIFDQNFDGKQQRLLSLRYSADRVEQLERELREFEDKGGARIDLFEIQGRIRGMTEPIQPRRQRQDSDQRL